MTEQVDALLRIKSVLAFTALSNSVFHQLRGLNKFPPPDGYLNDGRTPVWRASTIRQWIDAELERTRARGPTHRMASGRLGAAAERGTKRAKRPDHAPKQLAAGSSSG